MTQANVNSDLSLKFKFDAVFYYVNDLEKSIAFYHDKLGFPLISRDYVARFNVDGVLFELVPHASGAVVAASGNARLSLGTDDIRQTVSQLQARGVKTSEVKQETGGLLAFFHDPDGNELCLWQST